MAANSTRPPSRWRGAKLFFPVVRPWFVCLSMEGRKIVFSFCSSFVRLPLDGSGVCLVYLVQFCTPSILQFLEVRSEFVRASTSKTGRVLRPKEPPGHQETRRPGHRAAAGLVVYICFWAQIVDYVVFTFQPPHVSRSRRASTDAAGWACVGVAGCGCGWVWVWLYIGGCGSILGGVYI